MVTPLRLAAPSIASIVDFDRSTFLIFAVLNEIFEIEGLKIGGLSGIIGRADKNFRLQETDYLKALSNLLSKKPNILLTHLSPQISDEGFQGDENITKILKNGNTTTLFCGHSHWEYNKAFDMKNETQILNADTKVFILTKE